MIFKSLIGNLLILSQVICYGQNLVLNEIMADNETCIRDEDGDYPDWIEIYNAGIDTLNLNGYHLSDEPEEPLKWAFPAITIHPQGHVFLFASGKNKTGQLFIHTNFSLDSEDETILLSNPQGSTLDILTSGDMEGDISLGRKPDGSTDLVMFEFPTPGTSNNLSNNISFSHDPGFYKLPFHLNIVSLDPDDQIFYTLDGTIPDTGSYVYSESLWLDYRYNDTNVFSMIPTTPDSTLSNKYPWKPPAGPVDKCHIIRARSFSDTIPTSKVYTKTYFVDSTIYDKYPYPVISLVTSPENFFDSVSGIYVPGIYWSSEDPIWTGNYYQNSDEWERPVHFEYFTNSGDLEFSQHAGVQIHGKQSRRFVQKSLKFYARKIYGEAYFDYPLLPNRIDDKYNHFILRNAFGTSGEVLIKDELAHDIARPVGLDVMDDRQVIIFLNGEYWGMQSIRDHLDDNYIQRIYGISAESVNLLENKNTIIQGTNEGFNILYNFISENDLNVPSHYNYVISKIDIGAYIDYQIAEIFLKNYDWPGSNIKFWQSDIYDSKWRWLFFDLDMSMKDYTYNMLEHATLEGGTNWPNPDWSTMCFRKLLENEYFRAQFITRFAGLLNTHFHVDTLLKLENRLIEVYTPEIERMKFRYGYPRSHAYWLSQIDTIVTAFLINRPCTMREHIMEFFNLDEFGFSCDTINPFVSFQERLIQNVFPNPGSGWVSFSSITNGYFSVEVIDMAGRQVLMKSNLFAEHPGQVMKVDLTTLENGMYTLIIHNGEIFETKKIILAR